MHANNALGDVNDVAAVNRTVGKLRDLIGGVMAWIGGRDPKVAIIRP